MPDYRIRPAILDDVSTLVRHRLAIFTEMGTAIDADAVGAAFREWVTVLLPAGTYHAWIVEAAGGQVVAGGGLTILPWPPGPWALGGRMAFVYNVYTEPAHRRRGIAAMIMQTIHAWCQEEGIGIAGLNASRQAQRLYESLGYRLMPSPMMVCGLEPPPATGRVRP